MIKQLNPYLHFNGTAEKAIHFYESTLGARVDNLMRWGDVPGMDISPESKGRVMHSELRIGGGALMIADATATRPVPSESSVQITLHFDDVAEMTAKFEALAAGGQVTQPLEDTFWGAKFGMLTDAYGVRWMFNCETKSKA